MEQRSISTEYNLDGNILTGYAVVWNRNSKPILDTRANKYFLEVFAQNAITDDLLKRSDVIMLLNHDKNQMLARNKMGQGSLQLELDEVGLKFSFEIPSTNVGNYVREMVERGDLDGCSFCFAPDRVTSTYNQELGMEVRTVHSVKAFMDVSVVNRPAYRDTSVYVREDEEPQKEEVVEQPKEEKKDDSWREELEKYKKRL